MSFNIIGTGSALPSYVLDNHKLSELVDTTNDWIVERTGIKERRILTNESLKDIAIRAACAAIEDSHIQANEIDLIICSTVHGEFITPSLSSIIQNSIKAKCPAFDINGACAGFIYALQIANAFLTSSLSKKILIISAEAMSHMCDYTDRSTCVLFGDGAGAVVLEKGDQLKSICLNTTCDESKLFIPGLKGNFPFKEKVNSANFLYMNGQEIYRFAIESIVADINNLLNQSQLNIEDIDYFLIHQANSRILQAACQQLKIPNNKILSNIEKYGNTSSACIPIMLDECIRGGIIRKGNKLILSAFGAGLTNGAALINL